MKNVTASGGVFSGACLVYHIWSLNREYEGRKTEINKLKSHLNIYKTDIENKKRDEKKNMASHQHLMDLNMQ